MKLPALEVFPHAITPTAMIGEVVSKILGKARMVMLPAGEHNIRSQAYGLCFFELMLQNEVVGYLHVDSTPICCGSNVVNIIGDIPQDIVDCFMECLSYTGMIYLVKAKVMPTKAIRLSSTVGVFNSKRDNDIYTSVSAQNPLGQGYLGMFAEQTKKKFPELKISYGTRNGTKSAIGSLLSRSLNYTSADFQFIGDNTLFVWGVYTIPVVEAKLYIDIFHALHNVNDMMAISTDKQFSSPKSGERANMPTTKVLTDIGWPVIFSAKNPGGSSLLSVHGLTKSPPPVAVSTEPAMN